MYPIRKKQEGGREVGKDLEWIASERYVPYAIVMIQWNTPWDGGSLGQMISLITDL